MRQPIDGQMIVTAPFGMSGSAWTFNRHMGIDLRAWFVPLYAPDDGLITERYIGGKGIQVLSMRIGNLEHRFLHLSRMDVSAGQSVKKGQRIGTTGDSGGVQAHLHWDIRKAGTAWNASFSNYVNPLDLLKEGEVMPAGKLTKHEVVELHNAYFGGNPGSNYDYRHVGGTLQKLIHDWRYSPQALKNKPNSLVAFKDKIIALVKGA